MERAERMPESFGLSAAFMGESEFMDGRPTARCTELLAVDCVAQPAANPNGLFSRRVDTGKTGMDPNDPNAVPADMPAWFKPFADKLDSIACQAGGNARNTMRSFSSKLSRSNCSPCRPRNGRRSPPRNFSSMASPARKSRRSTPSPRARNVGSRRQWRRQRQRQRQYRDGRRDRRERERQWRGRGGRGRGPFGHGACRFRDGQYRSGCRRSPGGNPQAPPVSGAARTQGTDRAASSRSGRARPSHHHSRGKDQCAPCRVAGQG